MTITGDQEFTRFRRKLEDVVTVAINSGKVVKADRPLVNNDFYCPVGCFPGATFVTPAWLGSAGTAVDYLTESNFNMFMAAFDQETFLTTYAGNPYYDLGRIYRARFP